MKLYVSFLIFIAVHSGLTAQTYSESFVACTKSFTSICELQIDNSISVTIKDGYDSGSHRTYRISTKDMDIFGNIFKINFLSLHDENTCNAGDTDRIISIGRNLYLNFLRSLSDTTSPTAGTIKLYDSTKLYIRFRVANNGQSVIRDYLDSSNNNIPYFPVEKAQIEISEGYITNLKIYITRRNKIHQYILPFAIGISSTSNLKRYNSTKLFEVNSPIYFRKLNPYQKTYIDTKAVNTAIDSSSFIYLGDVLTYDNEYQVDRRDYSPQNQKFNLLKGESKILFKSPTNKLFEAHIFTDFIGLKEDKPNGLVQTQITKRINLNSVQSLTGRIFYKSFIKSFGIFQYIAPSVTLSKLEEHNSRAPLSDLDSIRVNPGNNDMSNSNSSIHRYTSAIKLYQYQAFSAGLDLNVFYFNNNDLKYSLEVNLGGKIGITRVSDSLTSFNNNTITKLGTVNNYSVNSLQLYPELVLTFLPEERFNLTLSDRAIYYNALNPSLYLAEFDKLDYSKIQLRKKCWINTFQLLMTIQVNPISKLFGKVRLNSEWQNSKNNFTQVQVGYSTFILGR